jgi:hypothetical protein
MRSSAVPVGHGAPRCFGDYINRPPLAASTTSLYPPYFPASLPPSLLLSRSREPRPLALYPLDWLSRPDFAAAEKVLALAIDPLPVSFQRHPCAFETVRIPWTDCTLTAKTSEMLSCLL